LLAVSLTPTTPHRVIEWVESEIALADNGRCMMNGSMLLIFIVAAPIGIALRRTHRYAASVAGERIDPVIIPTM